MTINKINLRYLCIFFLCNYFHNVHASTLPKTIFALKPLTRGNEKPTALQSYIPYLQNAALPLTACFLYAMKKDDFHFDIIENPYTTAILLYITFQYGRYAAKEYQQKSINFEMKKCLQDISDVLIIGHGIRNLMTQIPTTKHRSINSMDFNIQDLELLLQKTYDTWISLFLEYKTNDKNQKIYIYNSEQIALFEILQASSHDAELMNLLINTYEDNHYAFDYNAILKHLENKLDNLHQKQLMHIKIQN